VSIGDCPREKGLKGKHLKFQDLMKIDTWRCLSGI